MSRKPSNNSMKEVPWPSRRPLGGELPTNADLKLKMISQRWPNTESFYIIFLLEKRVERELCWCCLLKMIKLTEIMYKKLSTPASIYVFISGLILVQCVFQTFPWPSIRLRVRSTWKMPLESDRSFSSKIWGITRELILRGSEDPTSIFTRSFLFGKTLCWLGDFPSMGSFREVCRISCR